MKGKIQQLKNQVVEHPLIAILGGVIFAGAGLAAYNYFAKIKKQKTPQQSTIQPKSFQQVYKEVILAVQQCISKHQRLNGEVIKCILQNQYKLAEEEFKTFLIKIRAQRRRAMQNKHEYRRLILSQDSENQEIMQKSLDAILAHFNIQKTYWIQNVQLWSTDTQENKEEWENLLIDLDNRLLDSLRIKQKPALSFKKLQEIYKFKVHSLEHLNESGIDFDSNSNSHDQPDLNSKYTLMDKYIQDLVFNKFGVQEQDLLYSQKQLSQTDKDKIYQIQDMFSQKMRVAIYGDDNSQVEENIEGRQENYERQSDQQDQDGGIEYEKQSKKEGTGSKKDQEEEQEQEDEGQYF